jgi:hypothetical protein
MGFNSPSRHHLFSSLNHFLRVTYRNSNCAAETNGCPVSGTRMGTRRIVFILNDLEDYDTFMASRRCVQFLLFTLDYGIRGG